MHPVSFSFLDAFEQSLKGKVVEGMDGIPLPIDIDFLHLIGTKLLRKEEFVIQENHDWYTHALGKDIVEYAKLSDVEVVDTAVPNDVLGTLCKKPFPISVIGLRR